MTCALRLALAALALLAAAARADEPFLLFDSGNYAGKPDLRPRGWTRAWTDGHSFRADGSPTHPEPEHIHEARLRRSAIRAAQERWLYVVNIEGWDLIANPRHRAAIVRIMDLARAAAPTVRVGLYAQFPDRNYWTPVEWFQSPEHGRLEELRARRAQLEGAGPLQSPQADELNRLRIVTDALERRWQNFVRWERTNDALRGRLDETTRRYERGPADAVDFIAPSVYVFYPDAGPQATYLYVRENLLQARRYGKPVYAYVWFNLHTDPDRLQPLEDFRALVRAVREHADGVIVWSDGRERWSEAIDERYRLLEEAARGPSPGR